MFAQELDSIPLTDDVRSWSQVINDRGQVAGSYETATGETRAFLYSAGTVIEIGSLGGTYTIATAINNSGDVVGESNDSTGTARAFLFHDGALIDLGTLGGPSSSAVDINDAGQVVGKASTPDGFYHAFRYSGGVMQDLGTLGESWSEAIDINEAGDVVGVSGPPYSGRTFLFAGGAMTDIGPSGQYSQPIGLSENGVVALNVDHFFGYIYRNGTLAELGGASDGYSLRAERINASGTIVGRSLGDSYRFAFVKDGAVSEEFHLDTYMSLVAFNDGDQVLLQMWDDSDESHIFVYSNGALSGEIGDRDDYSVSSGAMNDAGQIAGVKRGIFGSGTAFVTPCPPVPPAGCVAATHSSLRVIDSADDEDDSLKWSWKGAGSVALEDLGSPDTSTSYRACLYETQYEGPRLSTRYELGPSALWKGSSRGWAYTDKMYQTNGIRRLAVKPGAAGKSSVKLLAGGETLPGPVPYVSTPMTLLAGEVSMSLHNDATGKCMVATLTTASSEAGKYSGKSK